MMPQQSIQVLSGIGVAVLYGVAVAAIGAFLLCLFAPPETQSTVRNKIGATGFAWLGFVFGQGAVGVLWLILAMFGQLQSSLVWAVIAGGWLLVLRQTPAILPMCSRHITAARQTLILLFQKRFWYASLAAGVALIMVFRGIIALVPTAVDDALWLYMTVGKVIGESRAIQFFPFVTPHNALYPLQVEMHWAALFAISNETAVTVWDYFCGLSLLAGIAYLTRHLTSSRRAALIAVMIVLSTPGFYTLLGGAKADNAAAQYGIAAFLLLALWPNLDRRAIILAGLCAGWAIASRYTNVILLPGLGAFALAHYYRQSGASATGQPSVRNEAGFGIKTVIVAGVAVVLAVLPMLVKNWLLVSCPLAPFLGCEDTFWAHTATSAQRDNLSALDLLFYPFVWTFGSRADMLGNISPLFLGLLPLVFLYRRAPAVSNSLPAGLAGFVSLLTWIALYPFILFTRFLLVPLGLFAVPLGASILAASFDLSRTRSLRLLMGIALFTLLSFLLFQSRGVVHAVRYVSALDSRAHRLGDFRGYNTATWLNANVRSGQRIALAHWGGFAYFLDSHHLLNSESKEERQWLWQHQRKRASESLTGAMWRFYANQGFSYVVLAKKRVDQALATWPKDEFGHPPAIVYKGDYYYVVAIDDSLAQKHSVAERR